MRAGATAGVNVVRRPVARKIAAGAASVRGVMARVKGAVSVVTVSRRRVRVIGSGTGMSHAVRKAVVMRAVVMRIGASRVAVRTGGR